MIKLRLKSRTSAFPALFVLAEPLPQKRSAVSRKQVNNARYIKSANPMNRMHYATTTAVLGHSGEI